MHGIQHALSGYFTGWVKRTALSPGRAPNCSNIVCLCICTCTTG